MKYISMLTAGALMFGLCASASGAFVINELDSDTPGGDKDEFVELKGDPNESAAGLIIVFYDGLDGSVTFRDAVDLSGLTADENGYILIASDNFPDADLILPDAFIRNAQDAVAIYMDSAANFPAGTPATTTNLVDAVVSRAIGDESNDWTGLGSPTIYNEGLYGHADIFSLSRLPDGTGTEFLPTEPTPGAANFQQATFTIAEPFLPRMNQATAVVPTTVTVTLQNKGTKPLSVTDLDLASTSSAAFSVDLPADPAPPVTLLYNETTTMSIKFVETDVSANKTYTGAINYATDNPSTPTGSVSFGTELVRATTTAAVGAVKVNEICYTGNFDHNHDGTLTNQNDEFVELYNTTDAAINIEGWEQRCTDNDSASFHSFIFPVGTTIPAKGFVTVFTSGNPTGFDAGTVFTYGIPRIRNNGAYVDVRDGSKLIDGVAYQLAEDSPDADGYLNTGVLATGGDTIGRRPDGADTFRTFDTADAIVTDQPSPNATNDLLSGISDWTLF